MAATNTFKAKPAFLLSDTPAPAQVIPHILIVRPSDALQAESEKSGNRAFSFGAFSSEDDGDVPSFLRTSKEVNAQSIKPAEKGLSCTFAIIYGLYNFSNS
jgi:hypothetical protein